GGIVVLDLSTSVDAQKSQRVMRVLQSLAETEGRIGLVVFSDSAYEMLPPDTRSEELRPLLRFFDQGPVGIGRPGGFGGRRGGATPNPAAPREESPWSLAFRGGTRISTGLAEARRVIAREGDRSLSVLLLSDLDDSGFDTAPLTEELTTYERDGIRLRVIPLFPAPEDRKLFTGIAGKSVFVDRPELLRNTTVRERLTLVGSSPWLLVAVGAALLGLLAINERWGARLTWGKGS
ncbi:MAG TPA: VWA domain-containing protein, partial [Gaiella sp.]|nr:VWA domain-containing protein [Gaiella sp.]